MVRLTAIETDSTGQTASAIANVTVIRKPPPSRVDIVFANGSSRVTEVDERYLIEDLTPMLRADPRSTVILIGYRDEGETGRALAGFDTQRVLNTAAVFSAGTGRSASLDLGRVQVRSDGTDQTDPPLPFVQSATDQRAQYRRVEVWFIPDDADKPAMSGVQPAPAREIKAKGCPK